MRYDLKDLLHEWRALKEQMTDEAAATLLLAVSVTRAAASLRHDLDDAICMGVRKGLFGAAAPDHADIRTGDTA